VDTGGMLLEVRFLLVDLNPEVNSVTGCPRF